MKKTKKRLWILIFYTLMFASIVLLLIITRTFQSKEDEWKQHKALLDKHENYVDGIIDRNRAYMIVGREERNDYGDLIIVFEQDEEQNWKRVYENDFTGLKPWKVKVADVDGDTVEDILTAVRKTTRYDISEDNRLFIFNYENNRLVKKWTGSRAAGRWKDFYAGDLLKIPGEELIFIEQSPNGKDHLSIYYWFDFGFIKLAESDDYTNILNVSITGENLLRIEYDNKQTSVLSVIDGIIRETE